MKLTIYMEISLEGHRRKHTVDYSLFPQSGIERGTLSMNTHGFPTLIERYYTK